MPDCIHHLDLCPDCRGLRVTTLTPLEGVTDVHVEAGPFSFSGEATLYLGPTPDPCPNPITSREDPTP